jgi:phenylacetate-CoA ligase
MRGFALSHSFTASRSSRGEGIRRRISNILYPLADKVLSRSIDVKLEFLRRHYALPWSCREERNIRSLHGILTHAGHHVPYYRDLFNKLNFNPDSVLSHPEALEKLPLLDKKIIQEQGNRLCDERHDRKMFRRVSGASIGPTVFTYWDEQALDWATATNIWSLETAGKRLGQRELQLYTPLRMPLTFSERCFDFCKRVVLNRANVFIADLSDESLLRLWRDICSIRPRLIQGYASTLYALARYVKKSRLSGSPFDIFVSTGEKLEDHKRRFIDATFNCRTFDRYGTGEFGVLAHETPTTRCSDRLNLMDHSVWAEELPVGGNLSALAFTSLNNTAMPLIRYCVGDLGQIRRNKDAICLTSLERRVHDIVSVGDRYYPTYYFQEFLTKLGGFEDFQLHVNGNEGLEELSIVLPDNARQEEYKNALRQWLPDSVTISFNAKGNREEAWRNKFRHIIKDAAEDVVEAPLYCSCSGKKLLIVCHSLAVNGANNHVRELVSLVTEKLTVDILSVSEGPMRQAFETLGASVSIYNPVKPPDFSEYFLILGNTLMTTHILNLALGKTPVAITVHESWRPEFLQQHIDAFEFGEFISEESIKKTLLGAEKIIFPAVFQKELYQSLLPRNRKLDHIYCTIPIEEIEGYQAMVTKKEARRQIGMDEDCLMFIQVGTVTRRKNQALTLQAFKEFCKRNPDVDSRLVFLGARRSRRDETVYVDAILDEIISCGLQTKVMVIETVPRPYPYLRAADVMLHPSLNEVLPLSILEAGAFHLPVIAARLDGLPEVIEDSVSGYLVDPTCIEEIVDKMECLATNSEICKRFGNTLYKRVLEQHHPSLFKDRWTQILKTEEGLSV